LTGTGASPITVNGLTGLTSYTFTVTASTPGGSGPASAASNSVTPTVPLPALGSAYEGGYFAGQISTAGNSIADYNLVIGPVSTAQASRQWKTVATATSGTTSVINGPANSANMNNATHPAAEFCEALTIGGYSDWYMPAQNELEVCYYNLKPDTTSNNTSGSTNPNAVPARASNYTAGNPAQTSATDFKDTGAQDFATATYWSSTESTTSSPAGPYAITKRFSDGGQNYTNKTVSYRVRAVRRVAV
jgi:hypothetical protein